jgi:hypothetical protein
MERAKAIQLIRDIDLRLAFLGVDLEATPVGSKPDPTRERALPRSGSRRTMSRPPAARPRA